MAGVNPASAVATAHISPDHELELALQHDLRSIKQEIKELKTMVRSLSNEFRELIRIKVEMVGNRFFISFPPPPLSAWSVV